MRRLSLSGCCALAVAFVAGGGGALRAAPSPFAGTWKVTVLTGDQEIAAWLVNLEEKDGQLRPTLLSAGLPNLRAARVAAVPAGDKSLQLTFTLNNIVFTAVAYLPPGEAVPRKLLGSLEAGGRRDLLQLERSDLKELDPGKSRVATPAASDLKAALEKEDATEKQTALTGVVDKFAGQPAAYIAALELLSLRADSAAGEAAVRAPADQAIKVAANHGREMQLHVTHLVARLVASANTFAQVGLDYAQQAERLLRPSDPLAQQVSVLKALASAQRKAGRAAEARAVDARVAKLDASLDQEYLKKALPFKPDPFPGRKGKGDRVVLLELFTGAQCPPCVAADVAFDGLLKTYQATEVVLLQYHLHIPGPDPLTNKDSEERAKFYGVEGTPALYLNGKEGPPVGGFMQHAKDRYDLLRTTLNQQFEAQAQAKLKLSADRKGDQIDIQVEVADLKKTGADVRLRVVLVEDVVRYAGRNGQRLHYHVVRGLPGGHDGLALKENSVRQRMTVSLAELSKALEEYLTDYGKKQRFLDDDRPLDLKDLKVIALVQDNATKEVLQAAQVSLSEAR
jgi:hypothetical protein